MSLLAEITIFPTDKGASVSTYVSRAVKIIRDSGLESQTGPMGTTIEGDPDSVFSVARRCLDALQPDCDRIYMVLKIDYRKEGQDRIRTKMESLEQKLAEQH